MGLWFWLKDKADDKKTSSELQRKLINPCLNLLPENMQEMNDYRNGVMEIGLNVTAHYPQ